MTMTDETLAHVTRAIRGLSMVAATDVAQAHGYTVRVVEADGVKPMVTAEVDLKRIRVVVENGLVVRVVGVG